VAEEIKQRQPFRNPAQEAVVALLRTTDVLRRGLDRVVDRAGLTGQQYNVLRILRGAGDVGLPTLEIAERMIEQSPGVTRLLDRLEAKGLVRRERCPNDRRQVLCWIQPAGLAALMQLEEPLASFEASALSPLGEARLLALIETLDLLRASPGLAGPAQAPETK
jgi:DNA-binding MarR family transcriptional regulator